MNDDVTICIHLTNDRPDDGGSECFWNVSKRLLDCTALQPRRQLSSVHNAVPSCDCEDDHVTKSQTLHRRDEVQHCRSNSHWLDVEKGSVDCYNWAQLSWVHELIAPMTDAVSSSGTSVCIYQTTRRNVQEENNLRGFLYAEIILLVYLMDFDLKWLLSRRLKHVSRL